MKALIRRRGVVALLVAGALVTVVGGVAWAAIPGPDGVIQGCYDGGGNLKVVEQLPCPKGYKSLAWNQTGAAAEPVSTYVRTTLFGDTAEDVFSPGERVDATLECDDMNDQITGAGVRGIPWTSNEDPTVVGITATSASVAEAHPGSPDGERPPHPDQATLTAINTSPHSFLQPGQGWIVCIAVD